MVSSTEEVDTTQLSEEPVAEAEAANDSVLETILRPIMSPRVDLVFNDAGNERSVQLFRRPLGAEFSMRATGPTRVSRIKPQSYARELGMQEGWAIVSIDGEDVRAKTLEETQGILRRALMNLPTED